MRYSAIVTASWSSFHWEKWFLSFAISVFFLAFAFSFLSALPKGRATSEENFSKSFCYFFLILVCSQLQSINLWQHFTRLWMAAVSVVAATATRSNTNSNSSSNSGSSQNLLYPMWTKQMAPLIFVHLLHLFGTAMEKECIENALNKQNRQLHSQFSAIERQMVHTENCAY